MRRPYLERPIYLSGAEPPEAVLEVVRQKARPIAGLMGATLVGVTAAYFGPKFFDWALNRWGAGPDYETDGETVELDVDE